jgi:hypothetical protein
MRWCWPTSCGPARTCTGRWRPAACKPRRPEVPARAHQDLIWSRQHEVNRLRSLLAGYDPAALAAFGDLTPRTAMTVLAAAPTPAQAARLTTGDLLDLLAAAGRGRRRSQARRPAVFAAPQIRQPTEMEQAMGWRRGGDHHHHHRDEHRRHRAGPAHRRQF